MEEAIALEPKDEQIRYLVHFADGGSGMRWRYVPLLAGDELADGGTRYRVARVEPPPNEMGFGHAWAEPASGGGSAPVGRCGATGQPQRQGVDQSLWKATWTTF